MFPTVPLSINRTEELSKICRVLSQKLIWEISASGWFYYKNANDHFVQYFHNNVETLWCPFVLTHKQVAKPAAQLTVLEAKQCQRANVHTLRLYIPVSGPMIYLSLCGLDMLACRGQLKCDGTCSETRFHLSAKWTSPFKSAGHQFSRLLAAKVCGISGNNAGYTMFRGSVKGTGYPLHSPVHLNRPVGVSSVDYWQPRCAALAVIMLDTPCAGGPR